MRRYGVTGTRAGRVVAQETGVRSPRGDLTRGHAVNWGLGVGVVILAGEATALVVAKAAGVVIPGSVWWLALLGPACGVLAFAVQLIRFTEEYRDHLYAVEEALGEDLDGDGTVGRPGRPNTEPRGAVLRGIDGQPARCQVALDPLEIRQVRAYLLQNGKASVRGLTGLVGDRASLLRDELIRLGVCHKPPHARAAAPLSKAGRIAVETWRG